MVTGGGRKRSVLFASIFGIVLIVVAVALNVSWIVVNWRTGLMLAFGVLMFAVLIAGLVLNTIFLLREIRRNEQHDAFINAVTHELKTPVASIRLYLQTLQERPVGPVKREEFYQIMLEDSERLQSTIDQILLAGKTAASGRVLNRTPVDVAEMADECVQLAVKRHHLPPGSIELVEKTAADDSFVVSGDLDELKAAVMNLVDNAVKYSGDRVQVKVEVSPASSKRVAIRVADEGVGISKNERKRIFRRFYRIPVPASRVKGTGLGLTIVRSVARRHGGRAYVESAGADCGSTFTLELPTASL